MSGGKVYPPVNTNAPPAYYGLKDQPLPYPATYREKKHRNPCCCFLKWFCSCFWLIILALGIAALVFWLVVRPKLPEYNVVDVRLTGLDTSAATGTLNTTVSFTLEAYNPNRKMEFYYNDIDIEVTSFDLVVGQGKLPAFHQGHRNRTSILGNLKSEQLTLPVEKKTALLTASENRTLPLIVKVDVKTKVKVGDVKSDTIKVKVRCTVNIDPTITGKSQVKSKSCKVKT